MHVDRVTTYDGTDFELMFATRVLKLESLHYGLWQPNQQLSIDEYKRAQQNYTDTLVKFIPKGVKTILDVGSGIGDNARALVKHGYTVTAISPDKQHARYYKNTFKGKLKFHNVKYEDFETAKKFDLVLMSESQNYFTKDVCINKTYELLNPGGYFFISGKFRRKNSSEFKLITNVEKTFLAEAKAKGFILTKQHDITKETLPTIRLFRKLYDDYAVPIQEILQTYLKSLPGLKQNLIKLAIKVFGGKENKINDFYKEHLDAELFAKHIKYTRILLQKHK